MKYKDITDVSIILDAIKSKNSEFTYEWDAFYPKTNIGVFKTLRYKILKNYWDDPTGEYGEVFQALVSNGFEIRRKMYDIYELNPSHHNSFLEDEMSVILRESYATDYSILRFGKYDIKNLEDGSSPIDNSVKKAVSMYLQNPKVFGRDIEGQLLFATYSRDMQKELEDIIKIGDRLPYSSPMVEKLFNLIFLSDDIDNFKSMIEANASYFNDMNKVIAEIDYNHSIPTKNSSSSDKKNRNIVKSILFLAYNFSPDIFNYLVSNDNFDLNLDGTVENWKKDLPKTLANEWERSPFNVYRTQKLKYSRDDFNGFYSTSLMFDVFMDHKANDLSDSFGTFKNYIDACIRKKSFVKCIESPIRHWVDFNTPDSIYISNSYSYSYRNDNFVNGYSKASDILFQFSDFRKILYSIAPEVMQNSNELDVNTYFHLLLRNSILKHNENNENIAYNAVPKEGWSKKGDYNEENLMKTIENNSIYLKYISEDSHQTVNVVKKNYNDIIHFLEQPLDNKELTSLLDFTLKFEKNAYLLKDTVKYEYAFMSNKNALKILLNHDLSKGGENNPLLPFFEFDGAYMHKILKTEDNKEMYISAFEKIIAKIHKDKSLYIPVPYLEYSYDSGKNKRNENILSVAIKKSPLILSLFEKCLNEEHLREFIQDNTINSPNGENHEDVLNAIYKKIDKDVCLEKVIVINNRNFYQSLIPKLINIGFDFDFDTQNHQQCVVFIKLLTTIEDEKTLQEIVGNDKQKFRNIYNLYADKDIIGKPNENILNCFQNQSLFNFFSDGSKVEKAELLFRYTNSEETYYNFLKKTNIKIVDVDNKISLLLEALANKEYGPALAMVKYEPECVSYIGKNGKLPMEIILKDISLFSKRTGKYGLDKGIDTKINSEYANVIIDTILSDNNPQFLTTNKLALSKLSANPYISDVFKTSERIAFFQQFILRNAMTISKPESIEVENNSSDFKI